MTRVIAAAVALLILLVTPASSFEWSHVAKGVSRSVVSIVDFDGDTFCTGFVIDNQRDFVMTAQHCVDNPSHGTVVDHKNAWVVWSSEDLDLAVLQAPGINHPELHPGSHSHIGQDIASFGHGYGLEQTLFKAGQVAHPMVIIKTLPGTWVMTNFPLIPGMSGGPMVDIEGKVIAINQRSNDTTGLGRSIADIYVASKDFWRYAN